MARRFIRRTMVVRLATMTASGAATVTPLWFVVDDGIVVTTAAATVAARNVAADPRVSMLFDGARDGRSDLVLRLAGTAVVHRGLPPPRTLVRIGVKYYVSPSAARVEIANARRWSLRARYYAQGDPVWLQITPGSAALLPRPTADLIR